jgi:hypothetical protein
MPGKYLAGITRQKKSKKFNEKLLIFYVMQCPPWAYYFENMPALGHKRFTIAPQEKKEKPKGKKARHLDSMLGPSHLPHEIPLPKRVHHHFWPGLIALAKNTLPIITHDIIFQ